MLCNGYTAFIILFHLCACLKTSIIKSFKNSIICSLPPLTKRKWAGQLIVRSLYIRTCPCVCMATPPCPLTPKFPDLPILVSCSPDTQDSHLRIPQQFICYIHLGQNNSEFCTEHSSPVEGPLSPQLQSHRKESFHLLLCQAYQQHYETLWGQKVRNDINGKSRPPDHLRLKTPQKPFGLKTIPLSTHCFLSRIHKTLWLTACNL